MSSPHRWQTSRPRLALTLLLLGAATTAPAQSTKERVGLLEAQVVRLERLLENNQSLQTDLLRRLDAMQAENQALRDAVDQLQFESSQGGDRQRQLYLDLDSRLQALEGGGMNSGAAVGTGAPAAAGAPPAGNPDADYQAAFEQLKQAQYAEAQASFTQFLATYADSELRGNAQYWLAETYYVTKDYTRALTEFQKVIMDYPTSRKIPDAWLKLGYCNYELERWADAKVALSTVTSRYSDSTAARLAEQRLAQLRSAGR